MLAAPSILRLFEFRAVPLTLEVSARAGESVEAFWNCPGVVPGTRSSSDWKFRYPPTGTSVNCLVERSVCRSDLSVCNCTTSAPTVTTSLTLPSFNGASMRAMLLA